MFMIGNYYFRSCPIQTIHSSFYPVHSIIVQFLNRIFKGFIYFISCIKIGRASCRERVFVPV